MKLFCLCLLVFCVFVIVIGIITIHELPGKIARKRSHPQAEAIHICSLLGLVIFPFWMVALLWAYIVPVFRPIDLPVRPPERESPASVDEVEPA